MLPETELFTLLPETDNYLNCYQKLTVALHKDKNIHSKQQVMYK
jgi:hypothetical protein